MSHTGPRVTIWRALGAVAVGAALVGGGWGLGTAAFAEDVPIDVKIDDGRGGGDPTETAGPTSVPPPPNTEPPPTTDTSGPPPSSKPPPSPTSGGADASDTATGGPGDRDQLVFTGTNAAVMGGTAAALIAVGLYAYSVRRRYAGHPRHANR